MNRQKKVDPSKRKRQEESESPTREKQIKRLSSKNTPGLSSKRQSVTTSFTKPNLELVKELSGKLEAVGTGGQIDSIDNQTGDGESDSDTFEAENREERKKKQDALAAAMESGSDTLTEQLTFNYHPDKPAGEVLKSFCKTLAKESIIGPVYCVTETFVRYGRFPMMETDDDEDVIEELLKVPEQRPSQKATRSHEVSKEGIARTCVDLYKEIIEIQAKYKKTGGGDIAICGKKMLGDKRELFLARISPACALKYKPLVDKDKLLASLIQVQGIGKLPWISSVELRRCVQETIPLVTG